MGPLFFNMPEGVKITTVDTDNSAVYFEMTAVG